MGSEVSGYDSSPESSPDGARLEYRGIFDRHHGLVYGFFRRRGFGREDALDLTQETFLRVFRSMERLRRADNPRAWLRRITVNVWKNELRRLAADKRDGQEISIDGSPDGNEPETAELREAGHALIGDDAPQPLDEALAKEKVSLLRQSLRDLPPQMRRCFLLRVNGEMKYREIADVLQVKIDTVKSQIHQARQRLTAQLDRYQTERVK